MQIDELAKQFTSLKELQAYSQSQYSVILALNQKVNKLEEDNKHLLALVEKATPYLAEQEGKLEVYNHLSDEMAICLMQIKILKDKSIGSELSFEDTKKLEIFTKTLLTLRAGQKPAESTAKDLSDTELLTLIESQLKQG